MDGQAFLQRLGQMGFYSGQIAHMEGLPARPAEYGDVSGGLYPAVQAALMQDGIGRLYAHQAEAIEHVRNGHNVVIVRRR